MRIAIVTDSTSDIPPTLAAKLNIHIIPTILVMEGQEYLDGEGISREAFYRRLPEMQEPPTTATPSAGTFEARYAGLFEEGFEEVYSIHAAASLSGLCNAASLGAQGFGERVQVEDSKQVSLGLGFQAMAAAELAAEGADMEKILEGVREVRERVRVLAMLDTLEQLRRSGRVSWARAGISSLLQVKPFIELREGEVLRSGQTRTRGKGIARLAGLLNGLGKLERLAVLHSNAKEDARRLLDTVEAEAASQALVVNVTTIIGTHVGVGGLGFAAVVAG